MTRLTLIRQVKHRWRFYSVAMEPNLFGDWLVIRSYGSYAKPAPMRQLHECCLTHDEAQMRFNALIRLKRSKGYIPLH